MGLAAGQRATAGVLREPLRVGPAATRPYRLGHHPHASQPTPLGRADSKETLMTISAFGAIRPLHTWTASRAIRITVAAAAIGAYLVLTSSAVNALFTSPAG